MSLRAGILLLLPLVAAAVTPACGDDGDGSGGGATCEEVGADGCFEASCWSEGPTRSFGTDVLPIFEQSCSLSSSCHGDPSSPDLSSGYRPYLGTEGPEAGPSDVAAIRAVLIGQPGVAASQPLVDPGKPENSLLMHKMDGTLGCATLSCATDCGDTMPQGNALLPRETRDVVRDWIAQGAQDN